MSYDFLKTPPRKSRDSVSPSRSSLKSYGGLFTRSLSSPQPVSPGPGTTSPQLSPVPSRHGGSTRGSVQYASTIANALDANSSSPASPAPARSRASLSVTNASTSAITQESTSSSRPQPSTLGSPFQPLKSQIPSVPRRLLVPTRGRLPLHGLIGAGSAYPSTSALPVSPQSTAADGASGRASRHSRLGSVTMNPESTPASAGAGSPPVRSSRSSITSRLGRPRSDSVPLEAATPQQGLGPLLPPLPVPSSSTARESEENRWLCDGKKFEVVEESVQLVGYQIYAVEKWIVERNRKVALLSVYTGDMKDKINVTVLAPVSSLSPAEQDRAWEDTMHDLRREGARPRETDKGVIMVTSLANFRSDYTVVHIPDGDFLAHREQLFVNINLLRMGCSGRTVLTLQEPSDTTKDRFMSMYHFRDDIKPLHRFIPTVLELVRLIHIGLSLFDMFPMDAEQQNGLLCDATVDGIKNWIAEVGEPYMKIEPNERVADPMTISAIITIILSMRNKLNSLGISHVPRDPFLHPRQFSRALASYINQRLLPNALPSSAATSSPSPPTLTGNSSSSTTTTNGLGFTTPSVVTHVHRAYLNLALIVRIDAAYEKHRATEGYKVHRVLFAKLDDITTATSQALATATARSRQTPAGVGGQAQISSPQQAAEGGGKERDGGEKELVDGTTDLAGFLIRALTARGRDSFAVPCVRYLWSGRLDQLEIKRLEGLWADTEKEREEELRERERDREKSDSDDEVGAMAGPGAGWSNKVQRKIESWAERGREKVGRGKKGSVDLTSAIKDKLSHLGSSAKAQLPSVVVSRDGDQLSGLSSGQVSPISPTGSAVALGGFSSGHNSTLAIDETEYQRRLSQFNSMHPSRRPSLVTAARSMTMPTPARPNAAEGTPDAPPSFGLGMGGSRGDVSVWSPPMSIGSAPEDKYGPPISRQVSQDAEEEFERRVPPKVWKLKRSYSSGDIYYMSRQDRVSVANMQTDVDLCAQLMVYRRRLARVKTIQAIMQSLISSSAAVNKELRKYHDSQAELLDDLEEQCEIVTDIDDALNVVDLAAHEVESVGYEQKQIDVSALWRSAYNPRQRVFMIRDRAFGVKAGKKLSVEVEGHGRFNRVQKTLDGRERFVDFMGRTESDVEEELDLPEIMPGPRDDDSEYEVEMSVSGVKSVQSLKERADVEGEEQEGLVHRASAWLLEQFSKWGRFMGVRGAATTQATQSAKEESSSNSKIVSEVVDVADGGGGIRIERQEDGEATTTASSTDAREKVLHEIPEENEIEETDENFQTAPSSKEHSRSPAR